MGLLPYPQVPQLVKLHFKVASQTHFSFIGTSFDKNFGFALVGNSNIVLHLDFDLETDKLLKAKSLKKGEKWSEEVVCRNPIKENSKFSIILLVLTERIEVNVNGRNVLSFPIKMPLENIKGIQLLETMELDSLEADGF